MHRPGQIENNIFLFDLEHAGFFTLPIKCTTEVEDTMKQQFKCLTAKIFVVNCSKAFTIGWSAVRSLLDPMVANKIVLIGQNTCDELKELVPPDQLLEAYGGKAQLPDVHWPPTIPGAPHKIRNHRCESPEP